jgi:hypothetical protein
MELARGGVVALAEEGGGMEPSGERGFIELIEIVSG